MKSSLWNRLAGMYDRTFTPVLNRDLKIIFELGRFKLGDAVLDYGGGTGRVAAAIKNRVARAVVADAAPRMVARAMAKGLEAVRVTGLPAPFPDASFNTILVIEAFHHMPDHEAHLKEFHRLLKPGGKLILEEPDPRFWWTRVALWIERCFESITPHTPEAMASLLERHVQSRIRVDNPNSPRQRRLHLRKCRSWRRDYDPVH